MLDALDRELAPLDRELHAFARRQLGCRALIARLYGVGPVSATAILAELGDARRFSSSADAVRHSGLDVTVYQSDSKRAAGRLSHEGPELLRWALFEAAVSAARASSPDHAYYLQVAERIDQIASVQRAVSRTRDQSCCAGRCSKRPCRPPAPARPTTPTTCRSPSGSIR